MNVVFLEGVYLDRPDQGLTPCFVTVEPPSDADIATVLQKTSHRVIRKLRRLGYQEAGMDVPVATGYDPLERLETLSAFVPLPRVHLVRYGGCWAPHSRRRVAIIPTPRQQGMEGEDTQTGTP